MTSSFTEAVASAYGAAPRRPIQRSVNLIVTSDPAPFEAQFRERLGVTILVFDDCASAEACLKKLQVDRVFADFHEIQRGRTGVDLLKRIRSVELLADMQVWLMDTKPPAGLASWVRRVGGAGLVGRSPRAIREYLATTEPWAGAFPIPDYERALQRVETLFARHSGPMACLHADSGRALIATGALEGRPDALLGYLAPRCERGKRDRFIESAKGDPAISGWFDPPLMPPVSPPLSAG